MLLLALFPLIILLPVYQITRKSRDKELKIVADVKSRGTLKGTFSFILLLNLRFLNFKSVPVFYNLLISFIFQ